MADEEVKTVLREAFGDSSSDSDGERRRVQNSDSGDEISIFGDSHIWEQITEINGLWICRDFLSADQQFWLLSALEKDGYFAEASQNQGIGAHVDLMRFEDGIAIISLESACVMQLSSSSQGIPLLLSPGSLVLMWGEARYLWKHEINRQPGFQIWEGKQLHQKRRTSVTLRRLSQTEQ